MMTSRELYELMFQEMGPQGWWPADDEIEMMIGAILVQNTSWTNVEKSLIRLKMRHSSIQNSLQYLRLKNCRNSSDPVATLRISLKR